MSTTVHTQVAPRDALTHAAASTLIADMYHAWIDGKKPSEFPDLQTRITAMLAGHASATAPVAVADLPAFPTMLRKMWSGTEVQQWIDDCLKPLFQERHFSFHCDTPTPWQIGNPDIPEGAECEFIVAVRRKHNGKVYVCAATFANKYDDEMVDRDGETFIADGWFTCGADMSGEVSSVYAPFLESGDEVIGWQPLPTWEPTAEPEREEAPRGTDAQILFERKLTCEAIDGAMALGYRDEMPAPEGHWLAPYWAIGRKQATLEAAAPVAVGDAKREAVMDAIAATLGDAYDCTRVWSAWGVGTMGQDDFRLISDDANRLAEIADAAIAILAPQVAVAGALADADLLAIHAGWQDSEDGVLRLLRAVRDQALASQAAPDAESADAKDATDTLVAVLNAIGYTKEFAQSHPDMKVSESVKLFLASQPAAPADLLKAPEGVDPMAEGQRSLTDSIKRLTAAYCVQQPLPIPDQMGLVWRADIGRLRNDWIRLNAWQTMVLSERSQATAGHAGASETDAFEAWAASEKYDMEKHPLHYLFLNSKTYAARQGWKAGLRFATAPTPEAAKGESA